MYCRNCGEQMNDNQAICLKCGVAVHQTNQQQRYVQHPKQQSSTGLAWVSLICGIVGFLCCGITSIIAIICGAIAKSRGDAGGTATAGLVIGIITVVLWTIVIVSYVGSMSAGNIPA